MYSYRIRQSFSSVKNHYNLYFTTELLLKIYPQIKFCTWNYIEAGNGKGPMDLLKRNTEKNRSLLRRS